MPLARGAVPPDLGQTAQAGKPTTLYAHVWNFGISDAPNVVVEFYWCDLTLGFNGPAYILLGSRWSRHLARTAPEDVLAQLAVATCEQGAV